MAGPWCSLPWVYNEVQCLWGRSVPKRRLPPLCHHSHHLRKGESGWPSAISASKQPVSSSGDPGVDGACLSDTCIRGTSADTDGAISCCATSSCRSEVGADLPCTAFLGAAVVDSGGSVVGAGKLSAGGGAIMCGRGCGTEPFAGVISAVEEEAILCLPLDSFVLP